MALLALAQALLLRLRWPERLLVGLLEQLKLPLLLALLVGVAEPALALPLAPALPLPLL